MRRNPARWGSVLAKSEIAAREPALLDTLTIRGLSERRSSGRNALLTVMTPNTFVSNT